MIIISTSFVLLYGSQNAYEMFTHNVLNVKDGCIYLYELFLYYYINSCIFKRNANLYRIEEKNSLCQIYLECSHWWCLLKVDI